MQITRNHVLCHLGPFRVTRPIYISSQSCSQNVVSSAKNRWFKFKKCWHRYLDVGVDFLLSKRFCFFILFYFIFFGLTFVMHKGLATFRNEASWMYSKLTAVHLLQIAILYSYEILVLRITLTLTIPVFPEWFRVKWIYLVCRMFSTITHKHPVNIKCNIVVM